MKKDFWKQWFLPENKKSTAKIFLILVVGIVLLVLGETFNKSDEVEVVAEEVAPQTSVERDEEQRMAELLSRIEGAGAVDVMITYSTASYTVVAQEEKTEESTTQENGKTSQTQKKETKVVLVEDSKGNASALILSENAPQVEGVVIVAEGGGNAVVCSALNTAAQALFNVPAHKIAVLKMK